MWKCVSHHDLQRAIIDAASSLRAICHYSKLVHIILIKDTYTRTHTIQYNTIRQTERWANCYILDLCNSLLHCVLFLKALNIFSIVLNNNNKKFNTHLDESTRVNGIIVSSNGFWLLKRPSGPEVCPSRITTILCMHICMNTQTNIKK